MFEKKLLAKVLRQSSAFGVIIFHPPPKKIDGRKYAMLALDLGRYGDGHVFEVALVGKHLNVSYGI